jgi:signal transduction histidine kinase
MMYGERDDPITVLSRLGQQLETTLAPDAVLPSLVETIAQTLKLPYVAIELKKENQIEMQPTISSGQKRSDVIGFSLVYQAETVGQLLVAPRALGESFSPIDRHLLETIARQAGMAVHAVSITNELQQARQRLVTGIEEERRRLRRDLHDGLGPALASQGLKLGAAKQLLKTDPDSAESLLDQVMMQNQDTVSNVRRLVYGLRPSVLDERGLAEAIRDHVWQGGNETGDLQLEVGELPADLPPLPAAVEVAAYRIALEALTNIIRHAQAKHCLIRFTKNADRGTSSLQMEIVDNGIGLPRELHAGIGLHSMRERAEELGGMLTVGPVLAGGTRVLAILPLMTTPNLGLQLEYGS